jgi:hypothetical protein
MLAPDILDLRCALQHSRYVLAIVRETPPFVILPTQSKTVHRLTSEEQRGERQKTKDESGAPQSSGLSALSCDDIKQHEPILGGSGHAPYIYAIFKQKRAVLRQLNYVLISNAPTRKIALTDCHRPLGKGFLRRLGSYLRNVSSTSGLENQSVKNFRTHCYSLRAENFSLLILTFG